MRQYFIDIPMQTGILVPFTEEISHHVKDVLRMKNGDMIRLVDSNSHVFLASLLIDKQCYGKIEEEIPLDKDEHEVIYIAAMIKKDKWEILLQKGAELGATKIVPLITDRTIIHLEEKEIEKKLERWNKITLEACQQSNRSTICTVERPIKIKSIEQYKRDINLVAYENETTQYIGQLLDNKDTTFVIGPEGGFTLGEIDTLLAMGFQSCSLGSRILRAETAGMYALALIDGKRNTL